MNNIEHTNKTSNSKIMEAFELLNEAAKEKKHEMKELMTDKYSHIKQAIIDGSSEGKKILEKAQLVAKEAITEGQELAKKTAVNVDKQVHENPWSYIGGVAVAALFIGYLMGSKRK